MLLCLAVAAKAGWHPSAAVTRTLLRQDPAHYGADPGLSERWWQHDMAALMRVLREWTADTSTGRRVAVVREPWAQHYAAGDFGGRSTTHAARQDAGGHHFAMARAGREPHALEASETHGPGGDEQCCSQLEGAAAWDNLNYRAVRALHAAATGLAPAVSVLPFYNATLARYSLHKQTTRAKCFRQLEPHGNSFVKDPMCICDCTHFCYVPLMYDDAFFTPLHTQLLAGLTRRRRESSD